MTMFREFHTNGRFIRSLNTIFLVLVPQKGGVEDLRFQAHQSYRESL